MKARQVFQVFGVIVTGAIFALAMAGSMHGLVVFAEQYGMAAHVTLPIGTGLSVPIGTLAFVACFDGFAISLLPQVHDEDGLDLWALGALGALTLLSAVIQYLAAPAPADVADAWKVKVVHTSPPVFAELAAAFTVRYLLAHKRAGARPDSETRSWNRGASSVDSLSRKTASPAQAKPVVVVGATLTSLDDARQKSRRSAPAVTAGVHVEDEVLSQLDAHFRLIGKAPSKRAVMDAVRHTVCGTRDKPGSCSDKRALEYLAKLNDMRQTGTG